MRRGLCFACMALCVALLVSMMPVRAETSSGMATELLVSMQRYLIDYGYLPAGADDGVFDDETERAVLLFQAKNGLWETGTINIETYNALSTGVIEDGTADTPQRSVICLEPGEYETFAQSDDATVSDGEMVWIPNSGRRYHRSGTCSGMVDPAYVTIEEAIARGFTPCKKCY